jgi:hypothetical protein
LAHIGATPKPLLFCSGSHNTQLRQAWRRR